MPASPEQIKFKPDTVNNILQSIGDGVPYQISAEAAGVHRSTFEKWVKKGMQDISQGIESDHASMVGALREIEKNRIKNAMQNIQSNEKGHRGYEWSMERSFWKYFSSHAQNIEMNDRLEKLEKGSKDEEKS